MCVCVCGQFSSCFFHTFVNVCVCVLHYDIIINFINIYHKKKRKENVFFFFQKKSISIIHITHYTIIWSWETGKKSFFRLLLWDEIFFCQLKTIYMKILKRKKLLQILATTSQSANYTNSTAQSRQVKSISSPFLHFVLKICKKKLFSLSLI